MPTNVRSLDFDSYFLQLFDDPRTTMRYIEEEEEQGTDRFFAVGQSDLGTVDLSYRLCGRRKTKDVLRWSG